MKGLTLPSVVDNLADNWGFSSEAEFEQVGRYWSFAKRDRFGWAICKTRGSGGLHHVACEEGAVPHRDARRWRGASLSARSEHPCQPLPDGRGFHEKAGLCQQTF